eukprot:scaffold109472_cov19-Tisochrysis_lutea.AAC.1
MRLALKIIKCAFYFPGMRITQQGVHTTSDFATLFACRDDVSRRLVPQELPAKFAVHECACAPEDCANLP